MGIENDGSLRGLLVLCTWTMGLLEKPINIDYVHVWKEKRSKLENQI